MASGMTLFELTVVNNWFILMNAFAFTMGLYTRVYFMVFYLFTMIVLTIVVSSFLEAFRFRIQYKKSTSKRDGMLNIYGIIMKFLFSFLSYIELNILSHILALSQDLQKLYSQNIQCAIEEDFLMLIPHTNLRNLKKRNNKILKKNLTKKLLFVKNNEYAVLERNSFPSGNV